MIEWKDATSYSREGANARGKKAPDAWEAEVGPLRLWVGSGHIYYPGQWVMTIMPIGINARPTGAGDARVAQEVAWNTAHAWLRDALAHFTTP